MNFGFTSFKEDQRNPSVTVGCESEYCVRDAMCNGLQQPLRDSLHTAHPIERLEKNRSTSEFQKNMNMLRNIQGMHAPLRIALELQAHENVGRLPFLPSSNLSRDVILGRDDCIDFGDVLNPSEMHEKLNRPHVVMERKLGLLK